MFSVRFHLGRGQYYKHWQVKDLKNKDVQIEYFDPYRYQLFMTGCKLVCNEKQAERVYIRGKKDVCGWIRCERLYVSDYSLPPGTNVDSLVRVKFNPLVKTHWELEDRPGENWNNRFVDEIVTCGSRCYLHCEALVDGV